MQHGRKTNNVPSQPSLRLGPTRQLVDEGNFRSHCTGGRRASWWMRSEYVPGPKHNIGQDPSRTTTKTTMTATTAKDTCCTTTMTTMTTMTTLTDDRRLLRNATTVVFSSCPLSLSLSLSLSFPLPALGPPGRVLNSGATWLQTICFPNLHCAWGRRASWWMRAKEIFALIALVAVVPASG